MNNSPNRLFHRETIRHSGAGDEKVIHHRGGLNLYAHVRVGVQPLSRGKGMAFTWNAGASIPARFVSAVVRGIQDAMSAGVLVGFELTDIHAVVENGSYHEVDSTAEVFREAAEKATKEALRQADPQVLEAWALVSIKGPQEAVVAVQSVVASYGEQLQPKPSDGRLQTIVVRVPSSHVNDLLGQLLQLANGEITISIANGGFRPRPEPPDTADQWVGVR